MDDRQKLHLIRRCIGMPWVAGGRGPTEFDCWGLFLHVQRACFDRVLPEIPVDAKNLRAIAKGFHSHPERQRWAAVKQGQCVISGDAVLMRQSRQPVHVGVWLGLDGGGVLHCMQGAGVVFQRLEPLALHGWQVEGFYRFKEVQ